MLINSSKLFFRLGPVIFFALLSALIIFGWFKQDLYYGGAEVGILGYNPGRLLEIQQYIWWNAVAPGMLVPQFVSAVPLYFLLSIFQQIAPPLVLQAHLFFLLLFLMGYGMYLFSLEIIGKERYRYAFMAGIFYMFNSYTMVEVWHRFLYTGFFLAACLPILALFWWQWMRKGDFIFLTLFLLTNFAFSYMFGNLTSFIVIWILCFMATLSETIFPWQGKKAFLRISYKFIVGFVLFLLTNLWWLIPVFTVSTGVLSEQHSSEDNINTLVSLGKQTILPYSLQYANPFYLFYRQELGQIYNTFVFLIIPWIPITIIILGLLLSLKKKYLASFAFAYLFVIIISKGVAAPFGHVFIPLLTNIFILGVLRNPFEKLGILLPFLGSILFVVGVEGLFVYLVKKWGLDFSRIMIGGVLLSLIIYGWPIFSGKVFDKQDYPLLVNVPPTYAAADKWLKFQKEVGGSILHLPYPSKGVLTYNWEHGYHGVEINEILFTAYPSITRDIGFKRVDATLSKLSYLFNKPFSENKKQVLKLIQDLDIRYIILHKDTVGDDLATYGKDIRLNNPIEIEGALNSFFFLERPEIFGDLAVYKVKSLYYGEKISFDNNPKMVYPGESDIMQIQKLVSMSQMITLVNNLDVLPKEKVTELLMFPGRVLYNWEPSRNDLENIVNLTSTNPNNPYSVDSQLKRMEKTFHEGGVILSEKLAKQVILSTDTVINLNKARINGQNDQSIKLLDSYMTLINDVFSHQFNGSNLQIQYKDTLARVFRMHLYILRQVNDNLNGDYKSKAKEAYDRLNAYLVKNYLLPAYILDEDNIKEGLQRRVHHFDVPIESRYEIFLNGAASLPLYPDVFAKLNIQIDGKDFVLKEKFSALEQEDVITLGNIELSKGSHEVSYNIITSVNIVPDLEFNVNKYITIGSTSLVDKQTIKLDASPQSGALVGTVLSGITGGESYEVLFEAKAENVGLFYLDIPEDTETTVSMEELAGKFEGCSKSSCYTMRAAPLQVEWQTYTLRTTPLNLATRQAMLRIILPPNNFSNALSTIQIRNLKVNRIMNNNLILRRELTEGSIASTSAKLIEMKKINPVRYEGKITIEKPTFMFFKETFNSGWKLELTKDETLYKIDKHYLGNLYNNTYYIDKTGEYNFKLEFEPQKTVDRGIFFSTFGWTGVLVLLLYSKIRRRHE